MGSGLSSSHRSSTSRHQPPATSSPAAAPALVIAADGSLREFASAPLPVSVSHALGASTSSNADGDDGGPRFFVCSSDALYFDADVPALGTDELLRPGQMYFVLPAAMLGKPLSSADMAALAVRASQALAAAAAAGPPRGAHGHGRRPRGCGGFVAKARVVPAAHHHAHAHAHAHGDEEVNEKLNQRTLGGFETTASRGPESNAGKSAVDGHPSRYGHWPHETPSKERDDGERRQRRRRARGPHEGGARRRGRQPARREAGRGRRGDSLALVEIEEDKEGKRGAK